MHVTRNNTKHLPHINKKYFTELKRKIINFMFMRLNKWIAMFWKYLILCCAYGVIYLMNKKSNYFPLQYIISMTFTKIKYCYMLSIMLVLFYIFFSSFFSAKFNFLITIHHLHFFGNFWDDDSISFVQVFEKIQTISAMQWINLLLDLVFVLWIWF